MAGSSYNSVGFMDRLGLASTAFLDVWRNPARALSSNAQTTRAALYEYMRAWDDGVVFMPQQPYRQYLAAQYRLYRYTRLLWNPIPSILNFWGGIIYPGNLSGDGLPFEGNVPTAVPFNDDIAPELAAAMAQIMTWGNWQATKSRWARMTATAGYSLLTLCDPLPQRKVYMQPIPPDHIGDVTLNAAGDVLMYAEQYRTRDSDSGGSREYVYRREVDANTISTYRDGIPYSYDGVPSVLEHPYGFCPAVWTKFREPNDGGLFGERAIKSAWGTLGMLAEINSLESRVDDAVHKNVETLTVFFTDQDITPLFKKGKRAATDLLTPSDLDRESIPMLKGPPEARVQQLASMLDMAGTAGYLNDKKTAFKQEYPEYEMYVQLRAMSQVTGPAAEILLGDIANPVRDARAQFDRQLVKALQMAVSMCAILAHNVWPALGPMDKARAKFLVFDDTSYSRGELDFEIVDRPLIPDAPLSPAEKVAIADVKVNKLGVPKAQAWEELGYSEEEIAGWQAEADQDEKRAEMQAPLTPSPSPPATAANQLPPGASDTAGPPAMAVVGAGGVKETARA